MTEWAPPPARKLRLNPFAFPSETTLRFVLLVVFVLCGSSQFYGIFRGPEDKAVLDCMSKIWPLLSRQMASPGDVGEGELVQGIDRLQACAVLLRPAVAWKLAGICLVIVAAAAFYYLYPAWRLRIGGLEPIVSSGLPELEHELGSMVETARLPRSPAFVWNPLANGPPVAFGRQGRYYVALSGGFVTRHFYRNRPSFRAIVLHELAHIENGDVPKTYLTLSLWLAFLATALVPGLIVFFWRLATLGWADAASLLLNGILWTSVIVLSGLSVLRIREHYADVRASTWDRASRIDRALDTLAAPVSSGWRRYFRFHPDPADRREVVEDPSRLFRLRFADAFGIALAAWLAVDVLTDALVPFMPAGRWAPLVYHMLIKTVVPALVFALAIGAIGIGVWRGAFGSIVRGDDPARGTAWLAVALMAGYLPGAVVLLLEAVLQTFQEPAVPVSLGLNQFLIGLVASPLVLVGCLLTFRWISGTASTWFEIVLESRSPRPILLLSVASALVMVLGALTVASTLVMFAVIGINWQGGAPTGWFDMYSVPVGFPLFLLMQIAWAFPLAAALRRRHRMPARPAGWVFLDGASPEIPAQQPLRLGGAFLIAVVMGLIFAIFWQSVRQRYYLPVWYGDWAFSLFSWLSAWTKSIFGQPFLLRAVSAAGLQALAGAVVAARARQLPVACGLFAASVAGLIIVVADHFDGMTIPAQASPLHRAEPNVPLRAAHQHMRSASR
jgi:Zn-dependent protease with chaperone function